MAVRLNYTFTGIKCANCARKIETGIQKLEGIKEAALNFSLQKLSIEAEDGTVTEALEEKIQSILDAIEPGSKLIKGNAPSQSLNKQTGEAERSQKNETTGQNEKGEGHEQNCDHELCNTSSEEKQHTSDSAFSKPQLALYILAFVSYFIGLFVFKNETARLVVFITVYLIFGSGVLVKSARNILRGQIFDENFLMAVASIGAFIVGEHPEAAAVMMFYQIGEMFQDYAVDHSRKSIKSLLAIKPDFANLKTREGYKRVSPSAVQPGELIVVRPGERVPLDGVVEEGASTLDTSALTGESLPREIGKGEEILSGAINQSGVLVVKVTKPFEASTVSRILSLVENASQKKAVTERFITRFAAWYTPVVVGLAVLLAFVPPLLLKASLNVWVYRALIFLVLSCPCALVISIPLGFFGGIGAASKRGILVKGGNYLEALAKVGTVVFDKTGTLTQGRFEVADIYPADGITKEGLLEIAAHTESFSTHPLALSVVTAYGRAINKEKIKDYREYAGMGVSASVGEDQVLCGNDKLFEQFGINLTQKWTGTLIHVAVNGAYIGSLKLEDAVKADASKAVTALHNCGVEDIVMLTGDQREAARAVGQKLGIGMVIAELLPDQKVECLERILNERKGLGTVAFVGDGINDAPVLARADIGISMGGAGSCLLYTS
ncbi:MAG: heavy metal translocating P-type ATPase, partial [Clostridia bacterium]|nr:heavy metal translocating P-type ATPase [Clostridia bacterium]